MLKGLCLKRNLEFDAMYNGHGVPCKRAKLNSGPGRRSTSPPVDQLHPHTPERISPQPGTSSPFGNLSSTLTPEKMATNIKEEAHRLSRKKHLRFPARRTIAGVAGAIGSQITTTSGTKTKEFHVDDGQKPMFTLTQVSHVCQKMMEDQRQRIREEYEKVLKDKLAEQYDTFIRFDHDQLQKKLASQDQPSYLS